MPPPNDAAVLGEAIARRHPDPFRSIGRPDFEARVRETARRLATLDRSGAVVELMRLAALLGDRNGHTGIFPLDAHPQALHAYPLVPVELEDGVFVAASAASPDVRGLELRAVAGVPVDELLTVLEPLVPRDNPWTVRARRPLFLVTAEVLHGLGVTAAIDAIRFDLGGARRIVLEPLDADLLARLSAHEEPAYEAHRAADGRAVYVAYNVTRGDVSGFAAEVASLAGAPAVELVVLDLRRNGGGDNRTYGPLLEALQYATDELGLDLAVLIGRETFSAAMQLIVDLERRTPARFFGEPTGGSPNQYGDARAVTLPDAGLTAHVATIAWTTAGPNDARLAREPDVDVPLDAAGFVAGRDPVLAAALAGLA